MTEFGRRVIDVQQLRSPELAHALRLEHDPKRRAPRLALFEEEHRQERRQDDQQRKQQRRGDRGNRSDQDLFPLGGTDAATGRQQRKEA